MHRSPQDEILERRWLTKQIRSLGLIDILIIVLVGWMFVQIRKLTSYVSSEKIRIGGEDGAHNKKEYELLALITSSNHYTDVYKGVFQGKKRAIKRLLRSHYNVAVNERELLLSLDHPNIIRCYGYIDDESFTLIVLELYNCNLNDLVEELSDPAISGRKSYVPSQLKEKYCLWEADGYPSKDLIDLIRKNVHDLKYLHQNRTIHCDLKPANVLTQIVKEDMVPKFSDMGISKLLIDESLVGPHATDYGTSGWKAPELLLQDRHSISADMFSLGCLIFFCITKGNHPFGNASQRDSNIRNDNADTFVIEHMPEAHDLVNKLVKHRPNKG